MKIVLYVFLLSWFIFFSWMGYGVYRDTPIKMAEDSLFIKEHVDPSIAVIESFRKVNKRLPTMLEFREIKGVDTSSLGDTEYTIENDEDYQLAVWRTDEFEYYHSSNKQYITNNYTYSDGIIGMLLYIGIGFLPVVIWGIVVIRQSRSKKGPPFTGYIK